MAIDSAQKRASMINFGDGTTIHTLSVPDGSIERQHLLDCYSGITFASPSAVTMPIFHHHYQRTLKKVR